ncbi:MAG TPA: SRPBCC family protein [Pseudonocardia sp.]
MRIPGLQGCTGAVTRRIAAPVDQVFAVLADGWTYPLWVVGASHMRAVDADWPAVGSRLHHSVGLWPLLIEDSTEVLAMTPDRRLVLKAKLWPTGAARVELELSPDLDGTIVTMREQAMSGPARLIPPAVQHALLVPRNHETLARLDAIVRRVEQP